MKGRCLVCKSEIEVTICCSGAGCGCMGQPSEPPLCDNDECYAAYKQQKKEPKPKDILKVYFRGDSGIENPVDMNGTPISEGDLLTWDFGDSEIYGIKTTEERKTEPFYIVKRNKKGGLFAESIKPSGLLFNSHFYLHDFRFKYCVCIKATT